MPMSCLTVIWFGEKDDSPCKCASYMLNSHNDFSEASIDQYLRHSSHFRDTLAPLIPI